MEEGTVAFTDLPLATTDDFIGIPNTTDTTEEAVKNTLPLAYQVVFGLLIVLMVMVSMLGNAIVCFIVYRKPAMRSAINILLANMALSNILLAILCLPFAFVTLLLSDWIFGTVMCRVIGFLHGLFVTEAVCILFAISVDRYLIIVCRKDTLTPGRAKVIIGITWCISAMISFPPTVGWGLYHYYSGWVQCVLKEYRSEADKVYIILSFTLMLVMGYSYTCIARTVRRNSLKVHIHPQSLAMAQAARMGLSMNHPPWLNVDVNFKTRAFKTILILYVIYVICWIPYSVCLIGWNFERTLADRYIPGGVVLWLGYLNSTLNPIVYCWRIQKFREACLDILPKALVFLPDLPSATKRRINPGAAYECNNAHEQQSAV